MKPTALLSAAVFAALLPAQSPDTKGPFRIELELSRLPPMNQGRTGTCWSFSTTSFVESELERLQGKPVDLSELHTVYWAYVEKARRFVRLHGKGQFDEGGLSHDVLHVIDKHGLVPQAAYTGLCGGDTRHDHGEMLGLLKLMATNIATSRHPSSKWEAALQGVLAGYLGPVPDTVEVDGKSYTPRDYARKVLRFRTEDYRQVTSLAGQPFGTKVELLVPDNWMRYQDYWNVPVKQLLDLLDAALRKGFSAAIDIDVSEPGVRGSSVWTLPAAQERPGAITDALRKRMFDTRETTDDHLMHVVGIASHEDGRTFYLTKDSYGTAGPFRGHRMISRSYLMAKMLSFMVHKDGLDPQLRARFE